MWKTLLLLFFFLALLIPAFANNGWYSTLQGTASDVEQSPPPNGVTIAYNTTDDKWEFSEGLAPAGGTTGTCLEKNSGTDYDYSWVACSSGGSGTNYWELGTGNVGIGTIAGQNVGIGSLSPGQALDVNGTVRASVFNSTVHIDGINFAQNSTGLQSALNAYGAGTHFYLDDGIYDITGEVNSYSNQVTITGGRNAILKLHNSTPGINILLILGNDSVLDGFTVDGNSSNQGTGTYANIKVNTGVTGTVIKNIYDINSNTDAVIDQGTGTRIIHNTILNSVSSSMSNTEYGAISLYGDANPIVEDNYISGSSTGINCSESAINPTIENNQILGASIDQGGGIFADSCSGEIITGNIIINSSGSVTHGVDGIYLTPPSGVLNATVSNNILMDISGPGIEIDGTEATITGNRIYLENGGAGTSTDQAGIYINSGLSNADIDIGDNSINNSYLAGVQIGYNTGGTSNIRIHDNYITDSGAGGISFNNSSGTVSNISILDNHLISNTGYGIDDLQNGNVSNIQILGNIYSGNSSGNINPIVLSGLGSLDLPSGFNNLGIGTQSPTGALEVEGGNVGIGTPSIPNTVLGVIGNTALLGITASRSATNPATYIDSSGTIHIITIPNTPRYNQGYYTSTGFNLYSNPSQRLLVEPSSTNVIIDSYCSNGGGGGFSAYWRNNTSATVGYSNDYVNPLGGGQVCKAASNTANDGIRVSSANKPSETNGLTYTTSALVKGTGTVYLWNDGYGSSNQYSSPITLSTSHWILISFSNTITTSTQNNVGVIQSGAGTATFYVAYLQTEIGSSATSPIPTTSATLTRNAETISNSFNVTNNNVGIGSTAPGSTLDVNGTVNGMRFYGNVGIGTYGTPLPTTGGLLQLGGICSRAVGPVGLCVTSTGVVGYCNGAAGVCTTCTACTN